MYRFLSYLLFNGVTHENVSLESMLPQSVMKADSMLICCGWNKTNHKKIYGGWREEKL